MARLWVRLGEIYGHKWASQYGQSRTAMDTWQRGLRDLTREEISHGLRALMTREETWPPSLPEFRQLCRPPAQDPAHVIYIALRRPRANPERVASALAELRAQLQKPGTNPIPVTREETSP